MAGPIAPVPGDRYRLSEVLDNLVSNALKFTPAGGSVRLCVGNEGPMARLEVRDTGTGITADEMPHLFDRLYRSPRAVAEQKQGAGFGLPIVKQIVDVTTVGSRSSASSVPEPWSGSSCRTPALTIGARSHTRRVRPVTAPYLMGQCCGSRAPTELDRFVGLLPQRPNRPSIAAQGDL